MSQAERTGAGSAGCLLRVGWMLIGNVVLALCAIAIAQDVSGFTSFSIVDVLYWATVAALISVRYADIRYFNGQTADSKPADMSHFRRYAIGLPLVAAVVWAILHAVALG